MRRGDSAFAKGKGFSDAVGQETPAKQATSYLAKRPLSVAVEMSVTGLKWGAIIAVAIVGLIVAYSIAYPTTSYRFRITLNVDTPEGLKSVSSVMEVRTRRFPAWTTLGNNAGESTLTGEAVFVDLGPGSNGKLRNVVALLVLGPRGEKVDFYLLADSAFSPFYKQKVDSPDFRGSSWELPMLPVGTSAQLRGDLIPTLVTFADVNDAKTARAIHPGEFPQVFGKHVMFRDAKIETVSPGIWPLTLFGLSGEPVTRGIEKKLLWWGGPGRPASDALRAAGLYPGEPELAFRRYGDSALNSSLAERRDLSN
jgi:hypothetical protein